MMSVFLIKLCFALFAAHLATANLFGSQEAILDDKGAQVPGDNPLTYCQASLATEGKLLIDYVDLKPNPPVPGEVLTITASGNLTEEVVEGAYVFLQVKWGYLYLVKQKEMLCDQVKRVDKECPLERGGLNFTKDVDIPSEVPPGKYHIFADVYTKDDEQITCLEAEVRFS